MNSRASRWRMSSWSMIFSFRCCCPQCAELKPVGTARHPRGETGNPESLSGPPVDAPAWPVYGASENEETKRKGSCGHAGLLRSCHGGGIIQVIGGALSVRGRGEDGAGIVLEDFNPVGDIGGVFLARFLVQVKVGADKGAAQFGASRQRSQLRLHQ